MGKVDTKLHLTIVSSEEATSNFLASPGNRAVHATGPNVFSTHINMSIKPLIGLDETLTTRAWIDCKSAAALQRIRLRIGKEKWQKSYRYTDKGVFRVRKKPKDAQEAILPPPKWTKVRDAFYSYRTDMQGCTTVLEPSSLLLVATVIREFQPDRPLYLCVFNKKQLHKIMVAVNGYQQLKVKYVVKSSNNQMIKEKRINAVKISFHPISPKLDNEKPEEFSFLGLKGNFDIFVEQDFGLPVQVSGRIASFGKINLRLQRVEFAHNLK